MVAGGTHWRQTQSLLQSNRAGVRWLSQDLCPRREEIPSQSKVGGLAANNSLDQLFVQFKCTVMEEINGHYLQPFTKPPLLQESRLTGGGSPNLVVLVEWNVPVERFTGAANCFH